MMPRVPFAQIVMGLNSRNARLIKTFNNPEDIIRVNSKVRFKKLLDKHDIPTPETYDVVYSLRDSRDIPWEELSGKSMVIKPDRGSGGNGILVLRWSKRKNSWIRGSGRIVTQADVLSHVRDISDGQYSKGSLPDRVLIEEMIVANRFFKQLTLEGLSDIRVIVFNGVPLMAMLRIPTIESGGRANLHAGGIIVGVDIGSGVTTRALYHGKSIINHPETGARLVEIPVPKWHRVVEVAVQVQQVSNLGFVGVDVVIDQSGRVLVIEANAHPGLGIQLANNAGLQERVSRVRNLKVRSINHGIRVANELFSELELKRRQARKQGKPIIGRIAKVRFAQPDGAEQTLVEAKVDTGADSTSIDFSVAAAIGYKKAVRYLKKKHIFDTMPVKDARQLLKDLKKADWVEEMEDKIELVLVKSSSGATVRVLVPVRMQINKKMVVTVASVVDRSSLKYPAVIGSNDLSGFYVDPSN